MAEQHLCQRHGRPAVASRVRLVPDGTQESSTSARSTSPRSGCRAASAAAGAFSTTSSPTSSTARPTSGRRWASPARRARQVERVDVTQFFSDATRELLQRAAQTALEWGSLDLDSDHLLYAALQDDVVRHVLRQVDADPDAIAAQIEEEAEQAASARTSRRRCRPTRRPRCSPPTRSRASSARRTSGPSTCCSRWRATTRVAGGPAARSASVSRTRSCAAP